ncbi:hypothetical protein SAMN04490244_108151 [Tranquillimonas rosea]|uniref:Lipoprotein n=1 Tax=Tranquillimonas rosea TaxID=641238 RepID=A0A1H9VWI6_9RHOB|nr:hypothetical protein [Tranquillimonas rosea]SES25908.1 hypothetical protein SAMN04490244_108151 [Tranquillimonas rosea]
MFARPLALLLTLAALTACAPSTALEEPPTGGLDAADSAERPCDGVVPQMCPYDYEP